MINEYRTWGKVPKTPRGGGCKTLLPTAASIGRLSKHGQSGGRSIKWSIRWSIKWSIQWPADRSLDWSATWLISHLMEQRCLTCLFNETTCEWFGQELRQRRCENHRRATWQTRHKLATNFHKIIQINVRVSGPHTSLVKEFWLVVNFVPLLWVTIVTKTQIPSLAKGFWIG